MNKKPEIRAIVEKNNMPLRLKKAHTYFDDKTHTILTDDLFTYVDFYFKTHKRIIKSQSTGKVVQENYEFYWKQAKYFYSAAKQLPIESAPLPMYYAMLNAAKCLILYKSTDVDKTLKNLSHHGLQEYNDKQENEKDLTNIRIQRNDRGVFVEFSQYLDDEFDTKWRSKSQGGSCSVKELMFQLAFIHRAYVTTYAVPRNQELFVPIESGGIPQFYKFSDGKIYLVGTLQKRFFKSTAVNIPQDIIDSLPKGFMQYRQNDFRVVSQTSIPIKDMKIKYRKLRACFQYIVADERLWYMKRSQVANKTVENIDSLSAIMAITHRFSEIVRYKPEQLCRLLKGKENWIIHEFINLALDQYFDEIACEITGLEIMRTKTRK